MDGNKIIDIIANRAAARDKEVAFLVVENEQLKEEIKELKEKLKEKEKEV